MRHAIRWFKCKLKPPNNIWNSYKINLNENELNNKNRNLWEWEIQLMYLIKLYLPSPFGNSAQNAYLNLSPKVVHLSIILACQLSGLLTVTGTKKGVFHQFIVKI